MLGLFVLPVMVASIVSLTGGVTWVAAASATNLLSRLKGYKPHEGPLTPRACGKSFGVRFDELSEFEINRWLGRIGAALPSLFTMRTQCFDMTISEAELAKVMLIPIMPRLADFEAARELVIEQLGSEESLELLYEELNKLADVAIPAAKWLEQFPESRRKLS